MNAAEQAPAVVRWIVRLEGTTALDGVVEQIEPVVRRVVGTGARGAVLRGEWLGHAVHPLLTDVVLGMWTSASFLDVFGGAESATAARRLIGTGVLAAGPTAWAGWAEWAAAEGRDQRVGLVHAASNAVAVVCYAASYVARRRGRQGAGIGLAVAGAAASSVGGYLGSHLTVARKVGSRDPAFRGTGTDT